MVRMGRSDLLHKFRSLFKFIFEAWVRRYIEHFICLARSSRYWPQRARQELYPQFPRIISAPTTSGQRHTGSSRSNLPSLFIHGRKRATPRMVMRCIRGAACRGRKAKWVTCWTTSAKARPSARHHQSTPNLRPNRAATRSTKTANDPTVPLDFETGKSSRFFL